MVKYEVLWSQKANANSSTLVLLGNFIYEFIGVRFTLIAFIALFNFASIGFHFFDEILNIGISLILYFFLRDAFNVFWTGINLKYYITKQGILYTWGVFRSHELLIPFDEISNIIVLNNSKHKRKALIFENLRCLKNGDHGLSKEIFFNILSFENINELEKVVNILRNVGYTKITIKEEAQSYKLDEKLKYSYLYYKSLQLLSLIFLYIATNIGLNLTDTHLANSDLIKDVIVKQEESSFRSDYFYLNLTTSKGHSFTLQSRYLNDHTGEEVKLRISPIYNKVIESPS